MVVRYTRSTGLLSLDYLMERLYTFSNNTDKGPGFDCHWFQLSNMLNSLKNIVAKEIDY